MDALTLYLVTSRIMPQLIYRNLLPYDSANKKSRYIER